MGNWLEHRLVEERYRDLSAISHGTRRPAHRAVMDDLSLPPAVVTEPRLRSVAPELHRPVGKVVGEWLIRAGVKLGGASIQAS
jgi:hypothetical protein